MKKIVVVLCLFAVNFFSIAQKYKYPFKDPCLSMNERIDDLISRLTIEEKTVLMVNSSAGVERLGIPPYDWWNECLHGVGRLGKATVFP